MILILTLKSETTKEVLREGRARNTHVHTIHQPQVQVFPDIFRANFFLESNTDDVLGIYDINKDLTSNLEYAIVSNKGTKEVKQIVIKEDSDSGE